MLDIVGTFFSSIISGGMTGIFGVAIQRYFDLKKLRLDQDLRKQEMAHELDLRRLDSEIMERESQAKIQISEIEAKSHESIADTQAFQLSFNEPKPIMQGMTVSSSQGWLFVLLDVVRGLIRPGLTVYLCIVTTLVYFHSRTLLERDGLSIGPDQAMDLMKLIIGTVLYLTTTCVLWWFGTRNKQKPPNIKF